MSAGYFPKRDKVGLEDLFKGLVTAGHILHYHGVLDAHGHISVRSPDNPKTFWMLCDIPAALARTPEDLVEYNVEDGSAVEKDAKKGDEERSIDSEIYKRFVSRLIPPGLKFITCSCEDLVAKCEFRGTQSMRRSAALLYQ